MGQPVTHPGHDGGAGLDDTTLEDAVTDVVDRLVDGLEAAMAARPRDAGRVAAALEDMVAACRRDPRVGEQLDVAWQLDELAETYSELGRVDDALETMHAAIAAGFRSTPDPRCRLAEFQLRAGRAEPAHDLYAVVYADTPDDVWLHNNAGIEYAAAGDYHRALSWLTSGLEIALATGDPERLAAQLHESRRDALHALDQPHDELDARARAFLAQPRPPRPGWSPAALPGVLDLLDTGRASALAPTAVVPAATAWVAMALAWFPATEFATALTRWPHLRDDDHWATGDHVTYNQQLEHHLRGLSEQGAGPASPASVSLWIAPIELEAFQAWCACHDRDPAANDTRASYAADQARTHPDSLIAWPPERNQPCWCASGRKYKKCCGHPATATPA
jgi:tetratricopeptide (TPR) repeat protein